MALGPYTSTPPVSQALPPHAHSSQQNQAGAGTASDDDDDMPMAIRAKQLEDIPLATRAKQLGINLAHGSVMHVGVSNDHVEQTVNRPGRRSSSGEALDWFDASDSRWEGAMQRIKRRWADFTPDHEARMQQARISVRDVVATPVTGDKLSQRANNGKSCCVSCCSRLAVTCYILQQPDSWQVHGSTAYLQALHTNGIMTGL